jgi:ABC-2 type transport system permease protein
MLAIPALVPSFVAAYSVVGERQQGTLEPVLTTPIRREELLLGKALAALLPALLVAYVVYGLYLAGVELFADPAVTSALIRPSDLLAQLCFTPLLAGWSIWVAILISTRSNDVRVAQQFATLASLPSIAVTTLVALNVVRVSLAGGLAAAAVLLLLNWIGWRLASATFDRERLIIGTKS